MRVDPAILKWFDPLTSGAACLHVYGKSKIEKTQYMVKLLFWWYDELTAERDISVLYGVVCLKTFGNSALIELTTRLVDLCEDLKAAIMRRNLN
jgi:hypothetical protein